MKTLYASNKMKKHPATKPANIEYISIDTDVVLPEYAIKMFGDFTSLKSISGLDKVDSSKTSHFNSIFANDSKLQSLDISSWDTGNGWSNGLKKMFAGDSSLNVTNINRYIFDATGVFDKVNHSAFIGLTEKN